MPEYKADAAASSDSPLSYMQILREQLKALLWLAVIVLAANLAFNLLLRPRIYISQTTLVTTGSSPSSGLLSSLRAAGIGSEFMLPMLGVSSDAQLCSQIIRSESVRREIVQQHNLDEVLKAEHPEDAVETLGELTDVEVEMPNIVRVAVKLPARPLGIAGAENEQIAAATAEVAESYITELQQRLSGFQLSSAKRRRVFLEQKKAELKKQLEEAELELAHWQAANRLIAPAEVAQLVGRHLVELQSAVEEARILRASTHQQMAEARRLAGIEPEMLTGSEQRTADPAIKALREDMVKLQQALATVRFVQMKTDAHPDVQRLEVELATVEEKLAEAEAKQLRTAQKTLQANPVRMNLLEQIATLKITAEAEDAKARGFSQALAKAEESITGLSVQELEYGQKLRAAKVKETVYEAVVEQYEAALVAEQAEEPGFHVLDPPIVPYKAASPKLVPSAIIAVLLALLLGAIVVLLRGTMEPRSNSAGA